MTPAHSPHGRRLLLALAPVGLRLLTALATGAVLTVLVPIMLAETTTPRTPPSRSPRVAHPVTMQHVPEPPTTTLLALGVAAMLGAAAHGWRQGGRPQEDW